MILQCSQCSTQFRLDDSLLLPDGRQVACSKCNHQWFAEPPAGATAPQPTTPESAPEPTPTQQKTQAPPQQATPETPPETPQTVPPKQDDADLSPLDNDTTQAGSNPDFAMGDDITARLARIRESVQPKSSADEAQKMGDTPPTPTPPTPHPDAKDAYQNVDDYGLNDGAVFEKTPEAPPSPEPTQQDTPETSETPQDPTPKNPTETPTENPQKTVEEPVVKDIQNFETALSKASQLAEMAELKDAPAGKPMYKDATTGEPITDPTDAEEPTPEDSKQEKKATAKAQDAILQAVRNKKEGFKAKKEERPSHVRHQRSWFTQMIILLLVVAGLGVLGLLVAKDRVMDIFPETRPYYALIGAKVASVGKGLVILEPTASMSEKDGIKKLTITGTIENRLDTTEPLPTLMAQVKGMDGEVLVQWTFKGKQETIPPKGKVTYSTSITDPSSKANSVAVTIANMKKDDATTPVKTGNKSQTNSKKIGDSPKVTPLKKDEKKK